MNNPFSNRSIIKSDDGFYNRKRELKEIYSLLLDNDDSPQSIALIGQRRIGKSSLMYQIFKKRGAEAMYHEELLRTIMIWVSVTSLAGCSPNGFFARLNSEIAEQNEHLDSAISKLFEKFSDPSELFRQILNKLDRENYRLIILLDEFDGIVKNPALDKLFFDKLRSFMQEKRLAYVLSLQRELHRIWGPTSIDSPHTSPFFNPFHSIYLKGFEPKITREYLINGFEIVGKVLSDNELDAVLKIGGNFPFFINIAGEYLLNNLITTENPKFDARLFYSNLASNIDINANFEWYWQHLKKHHQLSLLKLCRNTLPQTPETDTDIDWLEKMSLICKDNGKYIPFSHLFKDFVLKQTFSNESLSGGAEDEIVPELTEREVQILHLLEKNYSNKQIGNELSIEENTVKTHLGNIFSKLGVKKRGEAKDKAKQMGLI